MSKTNPSKAQQTAQAAVQLHQQLRSYTPTVMPATLDVVTVKTDLRGALTPAEEHVATTPIDVAQTPAFHRYMVASSAEPLRDEVQRLTVIELNETATDFDAMTGDVILTFNNDPFVQMLQLSREVAPGSWSGG